MALLMSLKRKKTILIVTLAILCFSIFSPLYISELDGVSSSQSSASEVKTEELPPTVCPVPYHNLTIDMNRKVQTNNFLYTMITDKFRVKNRGQQPFNGLRLFFTKENWKQMKGVAFEGEKEEQTKSLGWKYFFHKAGYFGIKLHFPWYIE